MNCTQAREQLSELLYGGLTPALATRVETHLAGCADCRRELDGLKLVRQALDAVPPVTAVVDLPRVYRAAAREQERRTRRWRRATIALAALAAAVVLFAILPSLELRWEAHQFAVRWGTPPPVPTPPPQLAPNSPEPEKEHTQFVNVGAAAPDVEEQLRILSELVQRLADSDDRRRRDLDDLLARMAELREQLRQSRLSTERDIAALYSVQFPETKKGTQP